jgi:mono/diheme cytochrome c family protein
MRRRIAWLLGGVALAVVMFSIVALAYIRATGLDARGKPGLLETRLAAAVRRLAIPSETRARRNPVALAPGDMKEAMAHFADHCASCHANDGSGNTEMGRGLYPKAPDMRLPSTQTMSDGELFYVIEHGIRFTGMPAWSTGTAAGEAATWQLVHFIRHLPQISESELEVMKEFNPRSADQVRQEFEEDRFLNGPDAQ